MKEAKPELLIERSGFTVNGTLRCVMEADAACGKQPQRANGLDRAN